MTPFSVKEVRAYPAEIDKVRASLFLVEHNLKVAMSLMGRIYLMGKAHIAFAGTETELEALPEIRETFAKRHVLQRFLG